MYLFVLFWLYLAHCTQIHPNPIFILNIFILRRASISFHHICGTNGAAPGSCDADPSNITLLSSKVNKPHIFTCSRQEFFYGIFIMIKKLKIENLNIGKF
jgi:hypothetical protein